MQAYIEEYKSSYLPWRGGAYAKAGQEYCLGSKQDCERFIEDGAINSRWGNKPDCECTEIKALRLIPSAKQIKNAAIPPFVKDCVNLQFLAMPITFTIGMNPDSIPDSLNSLMLINSRECGEITKGKDLSWPPDAVLPNLRALQIFEMGGATELDSLLGIAMKTLPSLQFLECGVRKAKRKLETIATLTELKFLAVQHVANHDIFKFIGGPLAALSIVDAGSKFPIANMRDIPSIQFLWLNNVKCDLDCAIFASLPGLREVNVLNSTNIKNLEALLTCKRLESIQFINCGRPFSKEEAQLFRASHYKRLEIDFA